MSIALHRLTKSFGVAQVVDDLSLQIDDGEFAVLLGPSGCGKTTTLRMIAGLESATSGDILIDGERVNDLPPQRRDVAMVFQSYALYPHMTVAENVAYPLRVRKMDRDQISEQVQRTAAMLEIKALLDRRPRDLSGGERQRVALARAIVRHPRAFLMDEPLSNLDAKLRLQMRAELKHLQQQLGTTTVYVTHDQAEAMTLGHRVAVMDQGKLQQFDAPLTIYNEPANRFVAGFVGSPTMNFVDGEIGLAERRFVNPQFALPLTESQLDRFQRMGMKQVTMGMRPEHISVSLGELSGGQPASVYVTELMGNETFVILEIDTTRLVARAPGEFRAATSDRAWLKFDMSKAHWFDQAGARI
ncbi:MAG TPA: ABC transporter ATP-binding protein [Pyrinomonadaceae bacterium]|jgi:multiple sugar transport system ATP-binding protein|nr:ABC transporter ATP-binding protein [Pyrinomonadaceae bacterium]